ncbi:MAG: NifB/NifX family molybdenum-iron cluster-binding protein [Bellilinea sp.]
MKTIVSDPSVGNGPAFAEVLVGKRLRDMRASRGLSLRALADLSGLNVNTLSLVENGKSSPSVGTLQQLALALDVPISAFFETESVEQSVIFTPRGERPLTSFGSTQIQNLGENLSGRVVQPFVIFLQPGMGSGDRMIVHTGYEFVYCLCGSVRYEVEQQSFILNQGDSLVFEAHLPHRWENIGEDVAQILLVLYPSDEREELGGRHFSLATMKKELTMKIAVITDDGTTISRHFGRALYFLVLTLEEGKVVSREMREKIGHAHNHTHTEEAHGAGHGMDPASHQRHVAMTEAIGDCKALLCGGMGRGAYESLRALEIQPVLTEILDVDAAVQAFIDGKLVDHTELLH